MNIDCLTMTDVAILKELGIRIASLRLQKNLRQIDVSKQSGLSLDTVKRLEKGQGKLSSLVSVSAMDPGKMGAMAAFGASAVSFETMANKQTSETEKKDDKAADVNVPLANTSQDKIARGDGESRQPESKG